MDNLKNFGICNISELSAGICDSCSIPKMVNSGNGVDEPLDPILWCDKAQKEIQLERPEDQLKECHYYRMNAEKANKIYDLLVNIGGALESERDDFIFEHVGSEYGCQEWRFSGKLGFGGKYRSERNEVDCYREDETPKRLKIIEELNNELSKLI